MASTADSTALSTRERVRYLISALTKVLNANIETNADSSLVPIFNGLSEIDASLAEKRISVVGRLASGKSTFLNDLLEGDILPTGRGTTTTVPTEIFFKEGPEYIAKVEFLTILEFKEELRYVLDTPEKERKHDAQCAHVLERLSKLLSSSTLTAADQTPLESLTPSSKNKLIQHIGSQPIILEADTPALLGKKMAVFYESNLHIQCVLKKIQISGPFRHLPLGVVLVDTPGVGDESPMNSRRAYQAVENTDELWVLCRESDLLSDRDTSKLLMTALQNEKPVNMIVTCCDRVDPNEFDDIIETVNEKLREKFLLKLINAKSAEPEPVSSIYGYEVTKEEEQLVKEQMSQMTVTLTGKPLVGERFGMDFLIERLKVIFAAMTSVSDRAWHLLVDIEQHLRRIIVVDEHKLLPVIAQGQELAMFEEWRQRLFAFLDEILLPLGFNVNQFHNFVLNSYRWYDIDGRNAKKLMSRSQQGVHTVRRNKSENHYYMDVNADVAMAIVHMYFEGQAGRQRRVVRKLNEFYEELVAMKQSCRELQLQALSLQGASRQLVRSIYEELPNRIRHVFNQHGVYRNGKTMRGDREGIMPTRLELGSSLCLLFKHHNEIISQFKGFTGILMGHLTKEHGPLPQPTIDAVGLVLDFKGPYVDVATARFHCPISLELMKNPTRVHPCKHVFDFTFIKQAYEAGNRECPICRTPLNMRYWERDLDMERQILALPLSFQEPEVNWLETMWRELREDWQIKKQEEILAAADDACLSDLSGSLAAGLIFSSSEDLDVPGSTGGGAADE